EPRSQFSTRKAELERSPIRYCYYYSGLGSFMPDNASHMDDLSYLEAHPSMDLCHYSLALCLSRDCGGPSHDGLSFLTYRLSIISRLHGVSIFSRTFSFLLFCQLLLFLLFLGGYP